MTVMLRHSEDAVEHLKQGRVCAGQLSERLYWICRAAGLAWSLQLCGLCGCDKIHLANCLAIHATWLLEAVLPPQRRRSAGSAQQKRFQPLWHT